MQESNKAVFLDRDGTLIVDAVYPRNPAQVQLLDEDVASTLHQLKGLGFLLVLVSNQSGIGRGLLTADQAARMHSRLEELLGAEGIRLDGAYYCPHAPEAGCRCRKPRTELLLRAAADLTIDLRDSFMIGDKPSDVEAGKNAGCYSIQLGMRKNDWQQNVADFHADNWQQVLRRITLETAEPSGSRSSRRRERD